MSQSKTRISIVEDSQAIREVLVARIKGEDDLLFTSAYSNAEEALKSIPNDKPDVIIMDIGLPNMNGIECMVKIKRQCPEIQFLMFTVFEDSENVFEALKAGAWGYIVKDDGVEGVLNGIRDLEKQGAPMSKEIARKVLSSFHSHRRIIEGLSDKEHQLLDFLSQGLLYKEIADRMNPRITVGTVKQYVHRIYQKLQVNNRTEAINKYLSNHT